MRHIWDPRPGPRPAAAPAEHPAPVRLNILFPVVRRTVFAPSILVGRGVRLPVSIKAVRFLTAWRIVAAVAAPEASLHGELHCIKLYGVYAQC